MRAHSIRGIATSSAFFKNWSIATILDAAFWRSNSVFTSFYFKDLQFVYKGLHSFWSVHRYWRADWVGLTSS